MIVKTSRHRQIFKDKTYQSLLYNQARLTTIALQRAIDSCEKDSKTFRELNKLKVEISRLHFIAGVPEDEQNKVEEIMREICRGN